MPFPRTGLSLFALCALVAVGWALPTAVSANGSANFSLHRFVFDRKASVAADERWYSWRVTVCTPRPARLRIQTILISETRQTIRFVRRQPAGCTRHRLRADDLADGPVDSRLRVAWRDQRRRTAWRTADKFALDRNSGGEVGAPAPGALVGGNLPAWPPPPPNPSDAGPTPDPDPPPGGRGAPKTLTCEDYPQPRVFVENQSWWLRTPGKNGSDFGHAHMGACIPEGETLNQDTGFDVRVILHDNPGEVTYASLVVKGTDYETTVYKTGAELAGFTCPVGTCERWVKLPLRLADFQHSGLQEVRFRLFIREPDDQQMHTSLNWQVYVQNGATREDVTRRPWLRGKGWYTGAGYCEAALTTVPAPDAPLSGPWSPELRMVWHGEASDLPVTGHTVTLDPDFHATPPTPGTVLRQGAGPWEGTVLVDTRGLARGRHRLVSRADCDDPRGSTNSGVLVVTFDVAG